MTNRFAALSHCAVVLAVLAAFPFTARADLADGHIAIIESSTGNALRLNDVRRRAEAADIVLLGEVHDNPLHHDAQGQVLSWMFSDEGDYGDGGQRGAVVFEMLDRDQQATVDAFDGSAAEFGPAVAWEERGWRSPDLYMPVFEAMLAADVTIIASDLQRSDLMALYSGGADTLAPEIRAVHDLLDPLPPAIVDAMTEIQFASHCELMPRERMAGMVAVQRARDAALAEAVVAAHRQDKGPVALIAGGGHVRHDHGTGLLVRKALPEAEVLTIGLVEATDWDASVQLERMDSFDILWITTEAERPDPCDSLREKLTNQ